MRAAGWGFATIVAIGALTIASSAAANTFDVTTRTDPAPNGCDRHNCSLREAIRAANAHAGADSVLLPSRKPYGLSIANTTGGENNALEGDLDVKSGPLLIEHPGRGKSPIDAHGIDRVFDVFQGAPTHFVKLVIRGGDQPTGDGSGGGIRSTNANLTLTRTSVTHNGTVDQDGGGIAFPEGNASLTLSRSGVTSNFSGGDGGGLSFTKGGTGHLAIDRSKLAANESFDRGGGLFTAVRARITRTTVSGNQSAVGSGGGAAIEGLEGASVIKDSTISGNTAATDGGGLLVAFSPLTHVVNATIAGNHTAANGGGAWVIDSGTVSLNAVTIARNSADASGGGLFSQNTKPFKVENSLIGLNTAAATGDDCADGGDPGEEFDSLGHNLLSTLADCHGFDGPADLVDAKPRIGILGRYGGPTETIPLTRGSPAIGHAKRSTAPTRDQRGHRRGRHPDDGAYER
jgi:CSLREA domain-containing protein